MSSNLHGFDLVAALTESAINAQLYSLWRQGLIPSAWSQDFGSVFTPATLDITAMGAPSVVIDADDTNYHDLILLLPLTSGTYTENNIPIDIVNWTLAFTVDISQADLSTEDLQARIAQGTTPASVNDAIEELNSAIDAVFNVQNLFMDFTNTNFALLDEARTTINYNPDQVPADQQTDTTTDILSVLSTWFKKLQGTANPFVLGYPMSATSTPSSDDEVPSVVPTSISYSTSPANGDGSGTLNFLFMSSERALPDPGDNSDPVVFAQPLQPQVEGHDGVFAISAGILFSQLIPPMMADYGSFDASQGHWEGDAFVVTGPVTKGDLKGGQISVRLTTTADSSSLACDFTYTLTKDSGIFGLDWVTVQTVTQTVTWNVSWGFSVDDSGNVTGAVDSQTDPDISYDVDTNWWAELASFFIPFATLGSSISSIVTMSSFPNAKDGSWSAVAVTLSLVMPAGDVFTFAGSRFDDQSNQLVDVTWNT